MLVLPMLLLLLFVLLLFLGFNPVPLLKLLQTQGVRQKGLVRSLLLLLDSEQRILADLRSGIPSGVRILRSNEALVSRAELGDTLL